MLLRVQFGKEQKYVKLSELTFDAFLKEGGYSRLNQYTSPNDKIIQH